MSRSWKISLYLFFFGLLTLLGALFRHPAQKQYSPAEVLGSKSNLSLFVEPEDGRQPFLSVINSAQKQILVEDYLMSDPDVILSLEEADKRGVEVKVLLEEHPFGGAGLNQKTKPDLEADGVEVQWSNPKFTLTHEKTIIVDGQIVCVLTMNLTKTAFTQNREYNACDENPAEVNEAKAIFQADWERKDYTPTEANLVVSPDNSRGKLKALIKSATKSVEVEMEVLEDPEMIDLLAQRAQEIPVHIILVPVAQVDANQIAADKIPGVRFLKSPYIHAKLILVDEQRLYLGSVNLSSQSLDQNRELGILISQTDIVGRINQTFERDWEMAQ